MRRILKIILFLNLGLFLFCGCAKKMAGDGIVVWHWMTDREDAFNELAKRYKEKFGIDVNFELFAPSEAYNSKVKASAQTDTLPDVFGILGELGEFSSFIKAGHVLNLSKDMETNKEVWKKKLFAKALAVSEFIEGNDFNIEPGIYGVPVDVTNIQMVYNKKLFRKAGLDPEKPPRTWEEFVYACRKLKKANIQCFISGWGELWMLDCFASNYAFNIAGRDKVIATIKGDVPYTDPDWVKVFSLFKEMREEGMLAKGIVTMVNKTAEQLFANERAAMALNGSWCVNVYHGMNPDLEYGVMLPPVVSYRRPMTIWGGAGTSFMVNAKSPKKKEAIKFLKWLTDREQQVFLAKATKNLPSNKYSLDAIPAILAQFADDMDKTTHPNLLPYAESPVVIEAFNKGIQSIIIGEKTPEQVAEEVQQVKEREIKRKNNRNK